MTVLMEDTLDSGVASRIRRVREAFAGTGVHELYAGFDETEFDEVTGGDGDGGGE